jgi:hypothetical protein
MMTMMIIGFLNKLCGCYDDDNDPCMLPVVVVQVAGCKSGSDNNSDNCCYRIGIAYFLVKLLLQ